MRLPLFLKATLAAVLLLLPLAAPAQQTVCSEADSLKVESLLKSAPREGTTAQMVCHFALQLLGTPYVGQTLEITPEQENLVINLRQMDCTTFVENCLALALCSRRGESSLASFARQLRLLRYCNGIVSYPTRNHYFSQWAAENQRAGFVSDVSTAAPPFTATQTLHLHFMSSHPDLYPALAANESLVPLIAEAEAALSGTWVRIIPSAALADSQLLRQHIKNGDILSLQTSKDGLDTSHLGIALWHDDGQLHLLHCSSLQKKAIDDPTPLHLYMTRYPSRIGIRVLRPADQEQ